MDITPVLVAVFAAVIIIIIIIIIALTVLGSVRQRRRRASRPARHVGERQSQHGRVFSNAPSHSTTPDSWG